MVDIIGNLGKLEWWVNTIIIGLIVSITAGFIRDLIPKWLSGISYYFNRRALRNTYFIIKKSRLIASNSNLFLEYLLSMYLSVLLFILLIFAATAFAPLHHFYELNPQYDPFRTAFEFPKLSGTTIGVVSIILLLSSFYLFYGFPRRVKILNRARKISFRNARLTIRKDRKKS